MFLRRSTRGKTSNLPTPMSPTRSKYFPVKSHIEIKTEEVEEQFIPKKEPDVQVKHEIKEEEEVEIQIPNPSPKRRKKNVQVKTEAGGGGGGKPIPKNFHEIYKHIKTMRSKIVTPVDTMGCANIPKTISDASPLTQKNYRFQLLVSLMLSSQTKDEVNFQAMKKMRAFFQSQGFKDGITLEAMEWIDEKKLDELIYSVGFHTRKAGYLKKASTILREKFDGDIPDTLEGLVSLPGVGPKMGFLTLQEGWGLNLGIGVDTHVHRLSKQFGWVSKNVKDPEATRLELESWLPRDLWRDINPVLVGFGQTVCLPRGRRCDLCTLSTTKLCPNVDRSLLKRVKALSPEEMEAMNRTIRGDITGLVDIEDLA